jgi:hypothetical protein
MVAIYMALFIEERIHFPQVAKLGVSPVKGPVKGEKILIKSARNTR